MLKIINMLSCVACEVLGRRLHLEGSEILDPDQIRCNCEVFGRRLLLEGSEIQDEDKTQFNQRLLHPLTALGGLLLVNAGRNPLGGREMYIPRKNAARIAWPTVTHGTVRALPAISLASKAPKKMKKASGGGFGASVAKAPKLDVKAKRLLKEMGGDVDAAEQQYFQTLIRKLEKTEPELYDTLMTAEHGLPTGAAYTKLVELFWDAALTYYPVRGRVTGIDMSSKMRLKVDAIAKCATAAGQALLDVGCGDGAMLIHLLNAGAREDEYLGIDVSCGMIDAAKVKYPQANFRHCDFLSEQPTAAFDCVLISGTAQYFEDQKALISAAVAWLRPGGRVVMAHAQGAAFVAGEHSNNPSIVRSCMLDPQQLTALAEDLELEVLSAEECKPRAGGTPHTLEGQDFYLVALKKHGGD